MDEQPIVPIVYKVLSDATKYEDESRFLGILHEAFARRYGKVPFGNIAHYGQGSIVNNSISGELGLIVDPSHKFYCELPEPHLTRLIDVVDGDGWMDVTQEI